ncbi:MAG: phage baseplate protein [Longimicrobiaceae bacterium]
MRGLSAADVVAVWERGQERHPVDRALLLLGAALPARSRDELAALTVGQRDGLLLLARERTLGPTLQCFVPCPACAQSLEFPVEVREILVADPQAPLEREHEVEAEGVTLRFRLLDSRDLAAVARLSDPAAARRALLARALLSARTAEGEMLSPDRLPEGAARALAAELAVRDPQAEVEFNLRCAGCGHAWLSLLDVAAFFWAEVTVQAKRLLREVHELAAAYGWREADVLGMSAARRAFYLEQGN